MGDIEHTFYFKHFFWYAPSTMLQHCKGQIVFSAKFWIFEE